MNHFRYMRDKIIGILLQLEDAGTLPMELDNSPIKVELPRDANHGDLSTNAAMVLAKPAQMSPINLANLIVPQLKQLPDVTGAQTAGPGFINVRLSANFWHDRLREILSAGTNYGNSDIGQGRAILVDKFS